MLPTSPQSAFDWEGGSIDELVQLLAVPALAVRVEVRTPSAGKPRKVGEIHMVAGGVYEVLAGELRGDEAMEQLRAIHPVAFRLQPRLPNPDDGGLQVPGPSEGTLAERPAAEIMRYCELYVLTCTVELWRDTDRAEIEYRKGEIVRTLVNNDASEARLPEILSWESGGYRIVLPALNLPAPARAPQAARAPAPVQKTPQPVSTPVAAAPVAAAPAAVAPAAVAAAPAARVPAPVQRTPQPVSAPVAAAPAPVAAAPAPVAAAPAPVAAAPVAAPAPQAAAAKAPARTIFGMPAAHLQAMTAPAGEQTSQQPQAPAEPVRTTAAGMRVDVYDRSLPERTTNTGVPVAPVPGHEEAAPAAPQEDLTTLPRAEREPGARRDSRPEPAQRRETEKVDSARERKPQKQQPKKKGAPAKAAPERERRPSGAAARPEQAGARQKGEMSLGAHIGIGLALGLGLAAIWWIIQMVKGG